MRAAGGRGASRGDQRELRLERAEPALGHPGGTRVPAANCLDTAGEFALDCDLVLLALGRPRPETDTVIAQLGCALTERGNVKAGPDYQTTVPGVFACGDARRGQSLVVWAI